MCFYSLIVVLIIHTNIIEVEVVIQKNRTKWFWIYRTFLVKQFAEKKEKGIRSYTFTASVSLCRSINTSLAVSGATKQSAMKISTTINRYVMNPAWTWITLVMIYSPFLDLATWVPLTSCNVFTTIQRLKERFLLIAIIRTEHNRKVQVHVLYNLLMLLYYNVLKSFLNHKSICCGTGTPSNNRLYTILSKLIHLSWCFAFPAQVHSFHYTVYLKDMKAFFICCL